MLSSPLERYCSPQLEVIYSDNYKFKVWRILWAVLADIQNQIAPSIVTQEQVNELYKNIDIPVDYEELKKIEQKKKHDVMAFIEWYSGKCPLSKSIIHYGATSAYIQDNTALIQSYMSMTIIIWRLTALIKLLKNKVQEYRDLPCLSRTHGQSAQPKTMGHRFACWLESIASKYSSLIYIYENQFKLLGFKGTTGTLDSFVKIIKQHFKNTNPNLSITKIDDMAINNAYNYELRFSNLIWKSVFNNSTEIFTDFYDESINLTPETISLFIRLSRNEKSLPETVSISGQVYDRSIDEEILDAYKQFGSVFHKICTDIRLLASFHEMSEPFDTENQVGSSAMPYKENPKDCERICSLSISLMKNSMASAVVTGNDWLERSLNDSAQRRFTLMESAILLDYIICSFYNIMNGLRVNNYIVEKNLMNEIPFMISEQLIIEGIECGLTRDEAHDIIRRVTISFKNSVVKSTELGIDVEKPDEKFKTLTELLKKYNHNNRYPFNYLTKERLMEIANPHELTGCSKIMVDMFLKSFNINNTENISCLRQFQKKWFIHLCCYERVTEIKNLLYKFEI